MHARTHTHTHSLRRAAKLSPETESEFQKPRTVGRGLRRGRPWQGAQTVVSDAVSALGLEGRRGGEEALSLQLSGDGTLHRAEAVLGPTPGQGDLASPPVATLGKSLSFSGLIPSSGKCQLQAAGSVEPCTEQAEPGPGHRPGPSGPRGLWWKSTSCWAFISPSTKWDNNLTLQNCHTVEKQCIENISRSSWEIHPSREACLTLGESQAPW